MFFHSGEQGALIAHSYLYFWLNRSFWSPGLFFQLTWNLWSLIFYFFNSLPTFSREFLCPEGRKFANFSPFMVAFYTSLHSAKNLQTVPEIQPTSGCAVNSPLLCNIQAESQSSRAARGKGNEAVRQCCHSVRQVLKLHRRSRFSRKGW